METIDWGDEPICVWCGEPVALAGTYCSKCAPFARALDEVQRRAT